MKKTVLCAIVLFMIYIIFMILDVLGLVFFAKDVLSRKIILTEQDSVADFWFRLNRLFPGATRVETKFRVLFIWHNFKSGRIYVWYNKTSFDKHNIEINYYWNKETWYIEKVDGKWEVVAARVPV